MVYSKYNCVHGKVRKSLERGGKIQNVDTRTHIHTHTHHKYISIGSDDEVRLELKKNKTHVKLFM